MPSNIERTISPRSGRGADLRGISVDDIQNLTWDQVAQGWWRINAELTCQRCGAYQAADSDPINDKAQAMMLCARLFDSVGWRISREGQVLCDECSRTVDNP